MARIRTIKPEFFTSEDICALSPLARLLYIGVWCEADREGRLKWSPANLKRRYLPEDTCDRDEVCQELIDRGVVQLYGDGLAWIPSFLSHQQINPREAQSVLPEPPPFDASLTRHSRVTDASVTRRQEGKEGKEGKGREGVLPSEATEQPPSGESAREDREPTPHPRQLQAAWNNGTTPPIPRCQELTPKRKTSAWARLRERNLDAWHRVIARIEASRFCRGENDHAWVATFDWLLRPDTATKVLEGKYDNREPMLRAPPDTRGSREARVWAEAAAALDRRDGGSA
jgi:hypothetical protein